MKLSKRQFDIVGAIEERHWLSVDDAVRMLGASPASIRRDLQALAEAGVVERVRGGARRLSPLTPFDARESTASAEKDAIARRAVGLLRPGNVVFIDGGTTTYHIGDHLPEFRLTLITNSVRLAAHLDECSRKYPELDLFLTGGYVFPASGLLVGPNALATLRQYHADWAFLSAEGIDPDGLYNSNELVVESERIMIGNATHSVVLIDHTKLGRRSLCRVAPLSDLDTVVCDASVDWLPAELTVLVA